MTIVATPESTSIYAANANVVASRPGMPSPPEGLSIAEERLLRKRELAAALRLFGKFGFGEGIAGHMTVRDPEFRDEFWVNPFVKSFKQMRVSDLIRVNEAGEVTEGNGAVNTAGFFIHSEVHKARPDVVAAAHTHSVYGRALASIGEPIRPINQDATAFYQDNAVYDFYGGPAGYKEEGERIANALGTMKAAVLQNHGLITTGHSVGEAAWWFISMERCAQVQLAALAAGTPIEIDHETAEFSYRETGTPFAGWLNFRPLWDDIIREQPDLLD
ncbi:ribulose-5-phosphate 4-epimerase/fuculose-1-phosphate aldolase [Mycolicibacterium sp. BK556]|uniref:class II aldolase/adducin family protein n=1 Tax=unclassified Mycolicibacterium TaxID=2636767 RepID=UPI0010E590B2|nr:ribulose-5-phosphate 4-epimerase/fuculose-1-phosphate aldolase [Mycolicibacterium sp. BK556]MBB3636803.1 ribulose-5-phosphate 4-epimerase/fuculose-1-phosphate aldolase [Mycolicibacterium sp. BK607]